ncbi:MAG: spore cortex-lytic protein [Ruminococcaceae bacterium]|nr:spore cortex-lytic protein [Oscillospiraceae bacterium]
MPNTPVIPESITVHLGAPSAPAQNVTIPFIDYVMNVASSEIYPTWPENAIRANMYAQISFALNRIYTQYYRSRGYDFDITNSTTIDQSFVNGRDIFDNIREIAGQIFNSYIRRRGSVEPLFAAYCDGIEVSCDGLSQWGTVTLANQGLTPYEILTNYFGDDIDIVTDVPVQGINVRVPEFPLRIGSVGDDVRTVQIRLNRISQNYPAIPKIVQTDGIFVEDTEAAVRAFQQIFNLTPDGIVGKATWFAIQAIYAGVKRLNELDSEGIRQEEITQQYPQLLQQGSTGIGVRSLQYYLDFLSNYYNTIPPVAIDGTFGDATRAAVIDLQTTFGLVPDGIVGPATWEAMYRAYLGIVGTVPEDYSLSGAIPFPGVVLRRGSDSVSVRILQEYLSRIAQTYSAIPAVSPTGYFGNQTEQSVRAFQQQFGLAVTGVVDALVWTEIADLYSDLIASDSLLDGQYPGSPVGEA